MLALFLSLATIDAAAQVTQTDTEQEEGSAVALQGNTNFYVRQLSTMGVSVAMDYDVANAVNMAVSMGAQAPRVTGYRVCVFSDNSQTARGAAQSALSVVQRIGGVASNMIYNNPFFRVYAGHCVNKTEATILLGRLRGTFPKAFIVQYAMTMAEINTSPSKVELPAAQVASGEEDQ